MLSMESMLRFAGKKWPSPTEPKPRLRHYAGARYGGVKHGGESFIFAGRTNNFDKTKGELSSTIQVFDHYRERWKEPLNLKTTGSPPKGLYDGGHCVSPSGDLYVYGGCDGSAARGGLYKLQLSSLEWSQLSGESDENGPAKNVGCRMVYFDKNKLAVVGGYALPPAAPLQPGARASLTDPDKCSTIGKNEIHIFDTDECAWSSPTFNGIRPPPTGAFTLTSIDEHRALMYGGMEWEQLKRVSDLYLVDFQKMIITKLEGKEGEPWPVGRVGHAACCLGFGSKHPHLLVTGGLDNDHKTLRDVWLFDVMTKRWKELEIPKTADSDVLSRYGHSAAAVSLAPGLIEVIVFGGDPQCQRDKCAQSMAATAILTFKYSKSTWHLTDVASINELGSSERIQRKVERIKRHARKAQMPTDDQAKDALDSSQGELHQQLEETNGGVERERETVEQQRQQDYQLSQQEQQLLQEHQQVQKEYQKLLQEQQHFQQEFQRLKEQQQQLQKEHQQSQKRVELAEVRAGEAEAQLHKAVGRAHQLSQQVVQEQHLSQQLRQEHHQLQQEYQQLQQEQQQSQERVEYAEVRAREAEAQLHEVQSHWIIPKSEIELTKEKLGHGAWGKVKVAKFRGTCVAAKCYHRILLSEHNLRLFRREISMAARLRHPNLVQFIGASTEGELILVTQLMTTSLGALMHHGALSEANITSISLDVARALNYLHLMQPHPIIHRDICSGNVLLNPLPEDCWKAKVSDYGSVNLLQHLTTAHPGNPFYAAPESEYPRHQTPKMDIYSFGVLLAEMLTNELPEKKDRHRQILKISVEQPNFVELVRQCLSEEGDHRPSAQEIITQLDVM